MDTSQYLAMFLEESMDNLQTLNESLLNLEQDPDNVDKVNEIFRVAHTLKGMSATMGYNNMSELTHKMEDVLSEFREGELKVTQEVVTVLFTCLDTLEQMVDAISEGNEEVEVGEIVNKLKAISLNENPTKEVALEEEEDQAKTAYTMELNEYDISVIKQIKEKGQNIYEINIQLDENTLLKAARTFLVVQALEDSGEVLKANPSVDDLENENFDFEFSLIYVTEKENEEVRHLLEGISELRNIEINRINDSFTGSEVSTQLLEKDIAGAVVSDILPKVVASKTLAPKKANHKKVHQSVRVDLDRLDTFMNMVSELVIHRTRLEEIAGVHKVNDLSETLEQVARTTSDLQDLVMKIRMLPLDSVFNRFPRLVRDLSVELGKEMELLIEGQDTELDRTVIDEIGEPLIHLIRNSVDHGIEPREERMKTGKNPVGKIRLIAYQEGTKAVIKVEDDGAGINLERVKAKAIKNGINVEGLSDDDIKNLIFAQGFSTNEVVTDVSGRGVGMDVVKTKISSLGGTVELTSEEGKGSSFIIRLPLTLQIIKALLVKVGGDTLAISLGYINEIIEFQDKNIKKTNNKEVILYRGDIIPLYRINKVLEIKDDNVQDKKNCGFVVITQVGDKTVGLLVDSLMGQQEIVIKPLGKTLKGLKQYIGATILGDGLVTLILDVAALV